MDISIPWKTKPSGALITSSNWRSWGRLVNIVSLEIEVYLETIDFNIYKLIEVYYYDHIFIYIIYI